MPTADDTPTVAAASSLVTPFAISSQNARSTSRRKEGAPGDFIGDRPVNSFIHPAGLPINTSELEVLQRPVESTQYTSRAFGQRLRAAGLLGSMGSIGHVHDNALAESFFGTLQLELLDRQRWTTRHQLALAIFDYIESFYNPIRRHSSIEMFSPVDFERVATRVENVEEAA